MSNASRTNTRGKTKDALRRCANHLTEAERLICEAHKIYTEGKSPFGEAFEQILKIFTMLHAMVIDIRDRL